MLPTNHIAKIHIVSNVSNDGGCQPVLMRNSPVIGRADHSGIPRTITFPSVQTVSTSYSEPMLETICGPDLDSSCAQLFQDQIRPTWIQLQKNLNLSIYDSMRS